MSRSTAPTPKQISYLKSLAEQTGTSFTYPNTPAQASREIERLLALKETGGRLVGVEEETVVKPHLRARSTSIPPSRRPASPVGTTELMGSLHGESIDLIAADFQLDGVGRAGIVALHDGTADQNVSG